jgi:NADH-quinone oxidoreductase subunit I
MWVTLRNMARTLFGGRLSTIQFPEQKRSHSARYRGVHILTVREDGSPKCVACYMCATACPAECIYIEAGERPEKLIEKYPTFEIDLPAGLMRFCGTPAPILMSRENDLWHHPRQLIIVPPPPLLVEHGGGYRPDDHDVRRPVRIAALERLETEHGIVPGMPKR